MESEKGNSNEENTRQSQETLKYRLLGASLTKAGQTSVDQQKVSEIIYNVSKGSGFFNHERERDRALTEKIDRLLARKAELEKKDLSIHLRQADEYLAQLEASRDLSQTIVHVDCDAFYAAVEELERPELKELPMAVGKGVLSTCNYVARKFGCRSGMASFIAQKLCPDLILLPTNFEKYTAKASEVRSVFERYDPHYQSASVDEACLNLTEYCRTNGLSPYQAVQNMRDAIARETKITVSAGIAPNHRIAKIASNWNKPNGQFLVANTREDTMKFIGDVAVRKVNGIGRVFERELDAMGIRTCKDIYPNRGFLTELFGQKAYAFLLEVYLGLGLTRFDPNESYDRKSIGIEHTFRAMSNMAELEGQLGNTARELAEDLCEKQLRGRTLVLKVKLATFEVLSRQMAPPKAVFTADEIIRHALPILRSLKKEIPDLKVRLMGLRCTHLISNKRFDPKTFFGIQQPNSSTETRETSGDDVCQDLEKSTNISKEDYALLASTIYSSNRTDSASDPPVDRTLSVDVESPDSPQNEPSSAATWQCPICDSPQPAENNQFNQHLDFCLSRDAIKCAVEKTLDNTSTNISSKTGRLPYGATPSSLRKRRASHSPSRLAFHPTGKEFRRA